MLSVSSAFDTKGDSSTTTIYVDINQYWRLCMGVSCSSVCDREKCCMPATHSRAYMDRV